MLVRFIVPMLTIYGRPRINRVDSGISVLQFKDVLKISFLLLFCTPFLRNFESTSCLERTENYGVSFLPYLNDIVPLRVCLVHFEQKCLGVNFFCFVGQKRLRKR